ncbi:hypothetical protein ACFWMU_31270 [Streptomyces sp. NPDC058357]|uniref:hypothetical protein n=1 Tax=Streptomyces sp. NPDC058357 TaxID=3346456 RepID=UPI0036664795
MRINDVAEVLPSMIELRRFQAEPHFPHILGAQFGTGRVTPAVYTYFDDADRLFCVAVDAAYGPQVTFDGFELTACVPAEVEQLLLDASWSAGLGVSYGPRGNPGVNGLGLVVRVQEIAGGVAARPVLVGRDWADRCTDDWEGQIPEPGAPFEGQSGGDRVEVLGEERGELPDEDEARLFGLADPVEQQLAATVADQVREGPGKVTGPREGETEGRLGEVEGLQVSLADAEEELRRLDRGPGQQTAVDLGIPATRGDR